MKRERGKEKEGDNWYPPPPTPSPEELIAQLADVILVHIRIDRLRNSVDDKEGYDPSGLLVLGVVVFVLHDKN